jgi:antagonist of KipI
MWEKDCPGATAKIDQEHRMSSLIVHNAGLHSRLVDLGRPWTRHLGVPLGGAADRAAFVLGNALVGNEEDAVAIEMTLAGPTLEARVSVACVVFGSAFDLSTADSTRACGTTFTLEPGETLRIGCAREGARGYLCVAGGFESQELLGSRSAFEPLSAGDELWCRASRIEPRSLPPEALANYTRGELRVLDGPQCGWFADDAFFTQEYEVTPASNRMGLRLKGTPLARSDEELVSEAVAPGAVQITNDGLPVVLGVDGQTIGGYPKIANVIRVDLDKLAQLRPGDRVRFVRVSPEVAVAAARERAEWLAEWLARLRVAERQPRFV